MLPRTVERDDSPEYRLSSDKFSPSAFAEVCDLLQMLDANQRVTLHRAGSSPLPPRSAPRHTDPGTRSMEVTLTTTTTDLDTLSVNTIRGLCMDAVQRAKSGHPGTPMGIAPVVYTLWQRFLRFDPADPIWPNRDRFVLSEGHASAVLWSLLHLTGVRAVDPDYEVLGRRAVTLDDLKTYRQLDSRCPGHPEYHWTSGVETTTGPLGQGVATSVGMAIAGDWLAARYNRDGFPLFDFDVYAVAGDGDMMEGISSEAASLAGHQRLSNLCWIYDSNRVTIEGHTDITFTEDVAGRFLAYGWNVTTVADANDLDQVQRALHSFGAEHERPTLVVVHSHIGYGSPVEDTAKAHGEPLGADAVRETKRFFGLPEDTDFFIPDQVYDWFAQGIGTRGSTARTAWQSKFQAYRLEHPELADEIERMQRRELPDGWQAVLPTFPADAKGIASRDSSGQVLNALAQAVPWLVGGSADLAPSTRTRLTFPGAGDFQADDRAGHNFHLGVREHAAAAIANGMALTKLRPYWSGFLIFSDYARAAIRLSALMEIPTVHIFSHDSIGVGADGPTHQPVEQLASLRAMPGLLVFRPADANEVVETWRIVAGLRHEPAALVLSRQPLPTLDRNRLAAASGVAMGGYVLADAPSGEPDVILLATGSEVALALAARDELAAEGIGARVVSMPCWELFDRQPRQYRDQVLPPAVRARVAVEQASTLGWERYVGDAGAVVGMHTFGASAPLKQLLRKFGFTPERVSHVAREQVAANA
jgi:transketolase